MENHQEQTLNDILETVTFIKENAASKTDLSALKTELTDVFETRLTETKTEIMSHVDGFITLHKKLEIELVALQSKYARLEGQLHFLAKHLNVALPEFSE